MANELTASRVERLIEKLGLAPHPEGGWYRETWRSDIGIQGDPARASATLIYFLIPAGQRSALHRVDASEFWLWHAGDPLTLSVKERLEDDIRDVTVGPDVLAGQHPQYRIPTSWWQAAEPVEGEAGFSLVSCMVSPGFEFSGFELAQ